MRILLVEDEEHIRKAIKVNLEMEGYEVVTSDNGRKALEIAENQHFELLILDIMLPEINGLQICEQVRLRNSNIGIIIVSAKDTSLDRITGLKSGADDYLTKPFNLEELLLRVEKLIKRKSTENHDDFLSYSWAGNVINFSTYQAVGINETVKLTKKEVLLLKLLIERKYEVVSRQQILQAVWGYDIFPSTRTIDNFILSFRKYFEEDPKSPKYFHSVRSVGYRFTPET